MQRFWRYFRFTLLIAAFLLLGAYLFTMTPWREKLGWGPNYRDIVQEGNPIVAGLYQFHARRGLWPEYLEDLSPAFLKTPPAPRWNYAVDPGEGPALATPTALARTNVGYDFSQHVWRVFGEQDNRVLAAGPGGTATAPATGLGGGVATEELAELDRRMAREPEDVEHRRGKASLLRSLGRWAEAEGVIEAAARALPEDYWPPLAKATLRLPDAPPATTRAAATESDAAALEELEPWTAAHPSFTHGYYLALAQRLAGENAAAIATIRAALKQPVELGRDDPYVLAFYLYDEARFALEQQQWALAVGLCDAWQRATETATFVPDDSYRALRAAAELAQGDFSAAQRDVAAIGTGRHRAGDLDALKAAIEKRDAGFRYAPGGPAPYRVFELPT
ncbi:MAG TPA: hypothetical protein VH253_11690 [Phycisphaerae bacterium]|nr:hypothetical protein [Phycisphaerae bacterium]